MTDLQYETIAAEEAETVVRDVSVAAVPEEIELALQRLRHATDTAIGAAAANLGGQEQLNDIRAEAAIALSAVIDQLNTRSLTQDIIDRATGALEKWKNKLAGPHPSAH
jgi:hypothetical protein